MSPVSVPPSAPGLHLLIVLAQRARTQENNLMKRRCVHSWNVKAYVGEAKIVAIGME